MVVGTTQEGGLWAAQGGPLDWPRMMESLGMLLQKLAEMGRHP